MAKHECLPATASERRTPISKGMGGIMRGGGNMMGMTAAGIVWMLAAAAVVVALIVVLAAMSPWPEPEVYAVRVSASNR